ncbi:hypothetical protein SAMN02983003_3108 [Devosia enhydra]|uniref:DUF6894 domain-containing protein n=1 Tax=Devosia enhydra TaxID=665118 RepID=A0A1K2I0T8_9HYPH|nr:hypothetical protein SAMN02983003_3108 [Devosia enhydra]
MGLADSAQMRVGRNLKVEASLTFATALEDVMPRFYFDIGLDIMYHDLVGYMFSDRQAAEREARKALVQIALDELAGSFSASTLTIHIRDERHDLISILSLTFARHSLASPPKASAA